MMHPGAGAACGGGTADDGAAVAAERKELFWARLVVVFSDELCCFAVASRS